MDHCAASYLDFFSYSLVLFQLVFLNPFSSGLLFVLLSSSNQVKSRCRSAVNRQISVGEFPHLLRFDSLSVVHVFSKFLFIVDIRSFPFLCYFF